METRPMNSIAEHALSNVSNVIKLLQQMLKITEKYTNSEILFVTSLIVAGSLLDIKDDSNDNDDDVMKIFKDLLDESLKKTLEAENEKQTKQ